MDILIKKVKDVLLAVLPVVFFVTVLNLTIVPVSATLYVQFLLGAAAIMIGLVILLYGIKYAILPFGMHMGSAFIKFNKLWYIVFIVFILGFFINFAEPDVNVLAKQVASVTDNFISAFTIRAVVALGAGTLVCLGAIRIIKTFSLRNMLIISYTIAFSIAFFVSPDFMSIGFDASGAATGAITVPLVLAMAVGMATMKKDCARSAEENSFGLVALMASGAIFGVLILNLFVKTDNISGVLNIYDVDDKYSSVFAPFLAYLPKEATDTAISLLPIFVLFIIFQKVKFHLQPKYFRRMFLGFVFTYIGLVIFFVGVHAGFMNMGNIIGYGLSANGKMLLPLCLGAGLGMLIILTEPAVYVLTHKIEEVTNGYIKRKTVLIFLSIGMAFAVGLSVLKIFIPGVMLWHYLLPGYAFALIMTFFTPKMFTGISFDSGAVSSGPMTVTFILAFSQGVSEALEFSDVLKDSFGIIAMVTMMPVISLQILGFIYKLKSDRSGEVRVVCEEPCCVPPPSKD